LLPLFSANACSKRRGTPWIGRSKNEHTSKNITRTISDWVTTMYKLNFVFPAIAFIAVIASSAQAEVSDITAPGDPMIATSANSPGSEGVLNAIDNTQAKYLNFDQVNTGFTVTPRAGMTIVSGLTLTSANDAPERDPTSYTLEGSYDGVTFTPIANGVVPAFPARFYKNTILFDNSIPFLAYRLIFPTIAGSTCCMQIGEVELLGVPAPQKDVTAPGDPIIATSANSPGSEGVLNAIDNTQAKYLNFDQVNTGFTVTPSMGSTVVTGISLMSANDAPDRDPTSYLLQGSLDGVTFFDISSGPVPAFSARFQKNFVFFRNPHAFTSYRLIFPTIAGSTCCMQVGEVELLGVPDDAAVPAPNQCPTAKALDVTVAQNALVNFQLMATDQEGDPLRYLLSQLPSHGAAALLSVQTGAASYAPTPHFCGVDRLTFKANDNRCGDSNEAAVTIRVTDAEPPSIANVQATPSTLRPRDHHMQAVTIDYAVSDSCSSPVSCQLSVSSNEPISVERRNHSAPDWQIIDAHHVNLRAERSERGWPRKYTVTVTCSDAAGFSASEDVTVTMPNRSREREHEREDR
jgi:hypothetical protein